jgi:hypothetical protein
MLILAGDSLKEADSSLASDLKPWFFIAIDTQLAHFSKGICALVKDKHY